jgi:hypothetical protein
MIPMRLERAAHLANILAIPPAYITLWLLLRPQPQQQHSVVATMPNNPWLIASLGAFFALFTFGAVLSVIALARKRETPATSIEPVAYAAREELVKPQTLPERVGNVVHDLLQFLRDQGPPPPVGGPDWRASVHEALKINWERLPKIHDGYMARFHDRVEKVIYELGAIGIRDWELNNLVNKQSHGDSDIESIARRLMTLGTQIVGQEYAVRYELKPDARSQRSEPSFLRPKIVPVAFGPDVPLSPLLGLVIANDGEPAYDISFPEVTLGKSKITVKVNFSRLAKADGNKFCELWIEKSPNFSVGGSSLFEEMRTREIDEIVIPVKYKDADNHWYVTKCKLERDVTVQGGIAARYVGQESA